MKNSLRLLILALTLPVVLSAQGREDRDYNPNILIFTGEVRNFMDLATEIDGLQKKKAETSEESVRTNLTKSIEDKLALLQLTGLRAAESYFTEVDEATRAEFNQFLTTTLTENQALNYYYVFLGNAFAQDAERLVNERARKMKKVHIWSTVGGVVLGVAGGYFFLKLKAINPTLNGATSKDLFQAGLVGLGIAAAVSGGGYAVRYIIPVNKQVKNAKDFLVRYPHGKDFLEDLTDGSDDLSMGFAQLENLGDTGQ